MDQLPTVPEQTCRRVTILNIEELKKIEKEKCLKPCGLRISNSRFWQLRALQSLPESKFSWVETSLEEGISVK